jgi:UTP--glucose-1-phosphate uridylyltransferase
VLCAQPAIGDEPFAVLLGDDLIDSEVPCTRQLIDVFEKHSTSVVGVMQVPEADVSKYGIVAGNPMGDLYPSTLRVNHLVEKPSIDQAPSRWAIPGRYVLTPEIFECIRSVRPGAGGEIQLTDALQILAQKQGLLAHAFDGTRYDTGDRIGFIDATLAFAMKRPELADAVRVLMQKHLSLGTKK